MEILTNTEVLKFDEFVALLDGNKSARFVSVVYRAKETGELARHTILLNVNRQRACKVDLANLEAKRSSLTGLDLQAADELIASLKASIAGYNPLYTKHGYYQAEGNGNVQVSVLDKVYIRGYSVKKDVLSPGVYKTVKSKPLTIAKDKLRKEFKSGKCWGDGSGGGSQFSGVGSRLTKPPQTQGRLAPHWAGRPLLFGWGLLPSLT
jgi:hypothetical protein